MGVIGAKKDMGTIGTTLKPNRMGCRERGDRSIITASTTIMQHAPQHDQPAPGRRLAPDAGGGAGAHADWSMYKESASARPARKPDAGGEVQSGRWRLCTRMAYRPRLCSGSPSHRMDPRSLLNTFSPVRACMQSTTHDRNAAVENRGSLCWYTCSVPAARAICIIAALVGP